MAKSTRVLIMIAGALVTLVLVLLLVGPLLLPRDRIRAQIVSRVETQLQQPVRVGDITVRILPSPRFSLHDLEIGTADAVDKPHVTLASLDLRLRFWPLLQRRVEIVGIDLDRPVVQLRLTEPKNAGSSSTPAGERPPGLPMMIQVQQLTVTGGRVQLLQPNGDRFLELLDISQSLSADINPNGDLNLRGTTRIDTVLTHLGAMSPGRPLSVALATTLHYRRAEDRLRIEEGALEIAGLPATITGEVTGIQSKTYAAELNLSGGPARIEDIRAFLPAALAPQAADVKSEGTLAVQATISGPLATPPGGPAAQPDFDAHVQLTGGTLQHPRLPEGLRGIELDLRATPDAIVIERFSAESGDSRLNVSGVATDYVKQPAIDFTLEADVALALLGQLQARADAPELAGRASAHLRVQGPTRDPLALRANGEARLANVSASGGNLPVAIRNVTGVLRIAGQDLQLSDLSGTFGNSDLQLNGTVRDPGALLPTAPPGAVATLSLLLASNHLVLDELLPLIEKPRPGQAEQTVAQLARLSGRIQTSIDQLTFRETQARDVRGTLVLDRGLVRLENLDLAVFGGGLELAGNLDVRNLDQAAFDVTVNLRDVQAPALFDYAASFNRFLLLKDHLSGSATIAAHLAGRLDSNLALDVSTLTAQGDFATQNARLSGHPLQQGIASFLNTPDFQTLSIRDWRQPFDIAQGRLNLTGMRIEAGDIAITGNGWQSLDGQLQLSVDVMLPARLSGSVRGRLPAEVVPVLFGSDGDRLQIPLQLTGTVTSPKVSLDSGQIAARARSAVREQVTEARRGLESDIRERVEQALGGSAADSADTTRPDLQRQAGKLLRDLFKKR